MRRFVSRLEIRFFKVFCLTTFIYALEYPRPWRLGLKLAEENKAAGWGSKVIKAF